MDVPYHNIASMYMRNEIASICTWVEEYDQVVPMVRSGIRKTCRSVRLLDQLLRDRMEWKCFVRYLTIVGATIGDKIVA